MTYINSNSSKDPRTIYPVCTINRRIKDLVADHLSLVWVEGEISNIAQPASGHIYFSLKDSQAQIRCVMFRTNKQRVPFKICNGLKVIVRAKVSLYEPRGDIQLIADQMEQAGFGALQRQFELLKNKLSDQGLFDDQRKRSLPYLPQEIAIITSPTGAAIQDFLKVSQRRNPYCKKSIYAVPVQGDTAAGLITQAVEHINQCGSADVIVIIRGGGSIEDLWAFNDEALAHAIALSNIPVVTGIGHEIDFTIADFVADLRTPTPSAAAEQVCPEINNLINLITTSNKKLQRCLQTNIDTNMQRIDWLGQRLSQCDPVKSIQRQQQHLSALKQRLTHSIETCHQQNKIQVTGLAHRLHRESPTKTMQLSKKHISEAYKQLQSAIKQRLHNSTHRLALSANSMSVVSPLNTLKRGYSITMQSDQQSLLTKLEQVKAGDKLITHVVNGQIISNVESIHDKSWLAEIPPKT